MPDIPGVGKERASLKSRNGRDRRSQGKTVEGEKRRILYFPYNT